MNTYRVSRGGNCEIAHSFVVFFLISWSFVSFLIYNWPKQLEENLAHLFPGEMICLLFAVRLCI